jgi:bifunctional oligoribonuclease and PAP phosphatase NrnA
LTGSVVEVANAIRERRSFILTSHARPDGDAVGSQLALAFALDALGKAVRLVDKDPVPEPYRVFPGVDRIELAGEVQNGSDTVITLECSTLARPEVAGLETMFIINIDHHVGNTMYGAINWFDESAAACGEMVAELVDALGVQWTRDIASHLFLAIATDTGGFRHGTISERTFHICQRIVSTGVEPAALSRQIFDSYSIGRVRLTGALLNAMELHDNHRIAILAYDDDLLRSCGATVDDTDGLINIPLSARDVLAVALFKKQPDSTFRVSLRSKGSIDVRVIAQKWGGGGHKNASGLTLRGDYEKLKAEILRALREGIEN